MLPSKTGKRTTYFGDATLLLAGGGTGAIAFAGACLAAESRGCRFHGAAATSIGSIVAALVAAGCSGREVLAVAHEIPRRCLLESQPGEQLCSSEPLVDWINGLLRTKLRLARQTVSFADLPRPLVIIASDLKTGSAKIWSRTTDPDASVGLAVRCACTNPFAFPPIETAGGLFVDGSLLNSLPFGMVDSRTFERCSELPALLFRLTAMAGGDHPQSDVPAPPLMRRIGDMAISRSATTPTDLPAQYQEIAIAVPRALTGGTLSRRAVSLIVRAGYNAATAFFSNEKVNAARSGYLSRRLGPRFRSNLVDQTIIEIGAAQRNVFVVGGDLSWSRDVLPSLALKALDGIPVRILCGKSVDPAVSAVLGKLGCSVRISDHGLLTYGAFIDADGPNGTAVLIKLREGKLDGGALIDDEHVPRLPAALMERLELLWQNALPQNTATQPEFEPVAWHAVELALRTHVEQYREADISLTQIDLSDVRPLTACLDVARLRRAQDIADLYKRCGEPLFIPMRLQGSGWFLAPPVVELVDGRPVVISGAHRVYHCLRRGFRSIQAIVVDHPTGLPPARISRDWNGIMPLPYELTRDECYQDFAPSRWRDLEAAWEAIAYQSLPERPASHAAR